MAHTNETPNYHLPQYVGTDIINPLVDTNGAYSDIDTALKNIADEVATDTSKVATLETTVGDSASGLVKAVTDLQSQNGDSVLTTDAQTLSSAINEVDAHTDTNTRDISTNAQSITNLTNNKMDKAGGTFTGNVVIEKTNETALFTAVDHASNGNNIVELYADDEGGNLMLKKGSDVAHVQLDTYTMNGSNGYARLYVGDSNTELKSEFKFAEEGYFEAPKVQAVKTDATSEIYAIKNNTGEGSDFALIKADGEGGNIRLQKKDGLHLEMDTNNMNGSTGYARLYLGDTNNEQIKSFHFNEDGSLDDGNGVNTGAIKSAIDSLLDYAVANPSCNATYFTDKSIMVVKFGKLVIGNIGITCDADIPVGDIVLATLPYPCKNGLNFIPSAIFQPNVTLSGYMSINSSDLHLQIDGNPLLTTDSYIRGEFIYLTD